MKLRVYLLNDNAIAPKYAHDDDSGMDLFSTILHTISPGDSLMIPHGLSIEIPEGYEAQIRPKSGISAKNIIAAFGTIDSGYRGELKSILYNISKDPYTVRIGEKVSQLVIAPVLHVNVTVMDDTQRKAGGFGSTGLVK